MENQSGTEFEKLTNYVRDNVTLIATGHGRHSMYAGDVLEGRSGFDTALDNAREILEMRKRQVTQLENALTALEENIANGGKDEFINAINELYGK